MAGEKGFGIDPTVVYSLAKQIKEVVEHGVEVAVVNGGGNIWRGLSGYNKGMDRATADYMGMLATVINSLALSDALENSGDRHNGCGRRHKLLSTLRRRLQQCPLPNRPVREADSR